MITKRFFSTGPLNTFLTSSLQFKSPVCRRFFQVQIKKINYTLSVMTCIIFLTIFSLGLLVTWMPFFQRFREIGILGLILVMFRFAYIKLLHLKTKLQFFFKLNFLNPSSRTWQLFCLHIGTPLKNKSVLSEKKKKKN